MNALVRHLTPAQISDAQLVAELISYGCGIVRSSKRAHEARMAARKAFNDAGALQDEYQADHDDAVDGREPWV